MLDTIPRKNRELNDAIAVLNEHLVSCGNDTDQAWEDLPSSEFQWVNGEIDKCLDPRYYCENYHVIKTEDGLLKTLYPFWRHQEIIYEAMQEEWEATGQCLIIILKPRQAGSTVFNASLMFHRTIFTPNAFTLVVGQNPETSVHIFKMINNAYHLLPWWLKPKQQFKQEGQYVEFQEEKDEIRTIRPGLGSSIQISNAQKMTGVAIGRTVRNFLGSEVSRWPDPDVFTADIEPSMNARDEFGVLESTAFGRNGLYYDHWRGSVRGDTGWRPVFIPVYRVRKYSLPIKTEKEFSLTVEEKAFTDRVQRETKFEIPNTFWNWRRKRVRACISSTGAPWAHYESYPITPDEAFQSSGICAFDKSTLLEQRNQFCCKPLYVAEIFANTTATGALTGKVDIKIREVPDDEILPRRKKAMDASDREKQKIFRGERLYIWELPRDGEFYYISGDVGLGVPDGDYSVSEVFRAGKGTDPDEQVAEWWGHIPPPQFSLVLAGLGYWYKGVNTAAEVAVEYKECGISTADKLYELDYPNLYRGRHKDRFQNQLKPFFHWDTNVKTRDLIIATGNESLLSHTVIIHSEDLIDEMFDFGSLGGKMEGQGNHDDGVLSFLINLYCLREATVGMKTQPDVRTDMYGTSGDIHLYGVFDNLSRQRGQYGEKAVAEAMVKDKKGWSVRPVLICAANTAYSVIHDGMGAENELFSKHGVPSRQILPELVAAYKKSVNQIDVGGGELDADDW